MEISQYLQVGQRGWVSIVVEKIVMSTSPENPNLQTCPVCGVKILRMVGGDRVQFSVGPAGTRATLWEKVCRHVTNINCINRSSNPGGDQPVA